MEKIVILDQALLPHSGVFAYRDLTDHEVKELVSKERPVLHSYLRFPSVINVVSKALNTILWNPDKEKLQLNVGDRAIVFVLKKDKGLLNLNSKRIREVGFEFKLLTRTA